MGTWWVCREKERGRDWMAWETMALPFNIISEYHQNDLPVEGWPSCLQMTEAAKMENPSKHTQPHKPTSPHGKPSRCPSNQKTDITSIVFSSKLRTTTWCEREGRSCGRLLFVCRRSKDGSCPKNGNEWRFVFRRVSVTPKPWRDPNENVKKIAKKVNPTVMFATPTAYSAHYHTTPYCIEVTVSRPHDDCVRGFFLRTFSSDGARCTVTLFSSSILPYYSDHSARHWNFYVYMQTTCDLVLFSILGARTHYSPEVIFRSNDMEAA